MQKTNSIVKCVMATVMTSALLVSLSGCPLLGIAGGNTAYIVTIQNLNNQPLGPVAIATHAETTSFWTNGEAASAGVQEVAELGSPATLIAEMMAASDVTAVVNSGIPFPSFGRVVPRFGPFDDGGADLTDTQVITIEGAPGDVISMASMLIGTNDGFWGLDSVALPASGTGTSLAFGFDAGTEDNDELDENIDNGASILGPAVIPGDDTGDADNGGTATNPVGVIAFHGGITGVGDIPDDFAWAGPIALVTITPVVLP
jgi:hypothetical protein